MMKLFDYLEMWLEKSVHSCVSEGAYVSYCCSVKQLKK